MNSSGLWACSIEPGPQRERISAVYALFGVALIPLSFFAIRLAEAAIHPTTFTLEGPQMDGSQFAAFVIGWIVMTTIGYAMYRVELAGKRADLALRELRDRFRRADPGATPSQLPEPSMEGRDVEAAPVRERSFVELARAGTPGRRARPQMQPVAQHRQPRRPRADNRHVSSGGLRKVTRHRVAPKRLALVVGAERLELSDRYRWLLPPVLTDGEADDACAFAKLLLRAQASAHLRQVARLAELIRRARDISQFQKRERPRDVVRNRARLLARGRGALDAPGCFDPGRVQVEPDVGLIEVLLACFRILLGYRLDADRESASYFMCHRANHQRPPVSGWPCVVVRVGKYWDRIRASGDVNEPLFGPTIPCFNRRIAMPRLAPIDFENLTPEQTAVADAIRNGPRGGLRGPFEAWLRSPGFADPAQRVGAYCRYGASIPSDLNEMASLMTGKYWKAQFEFWAQARLALHLPLEKALRERDWKELGTVAFAYDTDRYYTLRVDNSGPRIRAFVDRQLLIEAPTPELPGGSAGLAATHPAKAIFTGITDDETKHLRSPRGLSSTGPALPI